MSLLHRPGKWTLLCAAALVLGAIVFFNLVSIKNIPEPLFMVGFLLYCSPIFLAAWLDRKLRHKKLEQSLAAYGFVRTETDLCDAEIDPLGSQMKPHSLSTKTRVFLAAGSIQGRDAWIARHTVGRGKQQVALTSCAIRTKVRWPSAIVRRRGVLDRFTDKFDTGHPGFDKQREIRGEEAAIAVDRLRPLTGWFMTADHQPMSFRVHEVPGKREQWSFYEDWIMLADLGRTDAAGMIKMAEFLTGFADAAEASEAHHS